MVAPTVPSLLLGTVNQSSDVGLPFDEPWRDLIFLLSARCLHRCKILFLRFKVFKVDSLLPFKRSGFLKIAMPVEQSRWIGAYHVRNL